MIGILDDIWKHAPIDTPHGKIPTLNFEGCGDLLPANARLYWFTGERDMDLAVVAIERGYRLLRGRGGRDQR